MKSILLKYTDKIAPEAGTIEAHREVIGKYGYVWYGKIGLNLAKARVKQVLEQEDPYIILYNGATDTAYKAKVADFSQSIPDEKAIPQYYSTLMKHIKIWFKITAFEPMESKFSNYYITSSGETLQRTKKASMSSFFYITKFEEGESPHHKGLKSSKDELSAETEFVDDELMPGFEDLSQYSDLLDDFE